MRILLFCIFFTYNCMLFAYDEDIIKVAVIDTGYDFKSEWKHTLKFGKNRYSLRKPRLCKQGHKDFTNTSIQDNHGHGTHVAGLIAKEAKDANYCIVILKTWASNSKTDAVKAVTKAFNYATNIGVDIINYSGGGKGFFFREYQAVRRALNKGILVVAAAGNEKEQIDYHVLRVHVKYKYEASGKQIVYGYKLYFIHRKTGHITVKKPKATFFPAGYDPRIIAVENIYENGKLVSSSNHGEMSYYQEVGYNVMSLLPNNKLGKLTGTSQSAAIRTGKIVKKWEKK